MHPPAALPAAPPPATRGASKPGCGCSTAAGGSDLLLVAGAPPSIRVDGRVAPLAEGPLDGVEIEEAVLPALPPHARPHLPATAASPTARSASPGLGRFRINLHRERGRAAAAIRALPARVPRLATLGLPPAVEALTRLPRGLVLVGGPTGSGKTTTLAALVDEINRRDARHIVTIEDPIEYEHQHHARRRRAGGDRRSTRRTFRPRCAPRCARRPTSSSSARCAIRRRCGSRWRPARPATWCSRPCTRPTRRRRSRASPIRFPTSGRTRSGRSCRWRWPRCMTQTLLPKIGGGLVPAAELLMVGYGARQHIRKNALQHLHQEITITRKHGLVHARGVAGAARQGRARRSARRARRARPTSKSSSSCSATPDRRALRRPSTQARSRCVTPRYAVGQISTRGRRVVPGFRARTAFARPPENGFEHRLAGADIEAATTHHARLRIAERSRREDRAG